MLETRFGKLLDEKGCRSYSEFYHKAKSDARNILVKKIIDTITTNETLFFRDSSPFDLLKHKILPDLIDARSGKGARPGLTNLKIWSSACATGQELYSIAIVIKELLGNNGSHETTLMGTDLSDAAVAQASAGAYNKFEIQRGLPREKLQRYFTPAGARRLDRICNMKMLVKNASDLREAMDVTEKTSAETIQDLIMRVAELNGRLSVIRDTLLKADMAPETRIHQVLDGLDE